MPGRVAAPDRRLHPVGRSPVVDDRRSRGLRPQRANSGSSPMNVCRPDRTSSPAAMAARMIVRHASGRRPPVGAMPISSASGRIGRASASSSDRDDRDVVAGQVGVDVLAGLGRIEDGDDVVAAVADDAVRGLAAVRPELALGQDHEAAAVGRSHRPSVRIRPPPGCDHGGMDGVRAIERRRRGVRALVRTVGSAHPGRRRGAARRCRCPVVDRRWLGDRRVHGTVARPPRHRRRLSSGPTSARCSTTSPRPSASGPTRAARSDR